MIHQLTQSDFKICKSRRNSYMFTNQNTIREIMSCEGIKRSIGIFFPEITDRFVSEKYLDQPLVIVEKEVKMPWGAPFQAGDLIESANRISNMLQGIDDYEFVPLWCETFSGCYMPEAAKNNEETVCLMATKANRGGKKPTVILCPGGKICQSKCGTVWGGPG